VQSLYWVLEDKVVFGNKVLEGVSRSRFRLHETYGSFGFHGDQVYMNGEPVTNLTPQEFESIPLENHNNKHFQNNGDGTRTFFEADESRASSD
jgi:hypothetical protein